VIVVMGIPGAGKTTVLNEALKGAEGWRVINWGDRMLEVAKAQNMVKDRDEIRKLSPEQQSKLQADVAGSLAKEEGKWVLDTHCSVNTPKGYFPGLPFKHLEKLRVDHLVLVKAPVENILRRRAADASRERDNQAKEKVEEQLFVNKSLVCAYSAFTGAPVSFILNVDGKLEDAATALRALLE
jgi:adenylate kinase